MVEDFKNTDAGIIPNDWNAPLLSEISDFENGKAHEQFIDNKGDYIVVNSKFISQEGRVAKYSKENLSPLAKGSIAIVMSDIPNGKALAKCFSIDKDNRYTLNQRIGSIIPFDEIDNDYLFYKLNRNKYFLAFDSGSGQTNLKKSEILACPVALPPTKDEQTAISKAIKNADALINQLEKLLNKKRNIKTGAMQELLKPKDGWEIKKLGKIGECIIGLTYSPSNVKKEGILVLRSSNIKGNRLAFDDNVFVNVEVSERLKVVKSDVLICVRNGSRNLIGKCAYIDGKAIGETFGAFMSVFRSQFNDYIFHVFQSHYIHRQIEETIGATINQLTNKNLNSFEIPFPNPEEQKRISIILSDMDNEIQKIEKEIEKFKMLKQGMMQSLLTGKIRLI